MKILVTGAAGFIGFHLCSKLIDNGIEVIGFDNINDYYDQNLKKDRIKELENNSKYKKVCFNFIKGDLEDKKILKSIFENNISTVIHLAAQAGVRFSIENPYAYIQSNLVGFANIIEESRENNINHFIYASSSSVYGGNKKLPFNESDNVDHPISLYAATKKSNELVAHTYSHLFNLPTTGLRFFTVYGPWGRPDMAIYKFTDSIVNDRPIKVFNHGEMIRDFTYIDDVIESIFRLIEKIPKKSKSLLRKNYNPSESWAPYRILNIGNSRPANLKDYIKEIENNLGKKADIIFEGMQPGDVEVTFANTKKIEQLINFKPKTSIEVGVKKFISWFLNYTKQ